MTLLQALNLHIAAKKLSAKTIEDYCYNCDQYLPDWLDRPLAELGTDRAGVHERYARITNKNGTTTADVVFRIFRAIYNRGLREQSDFPANPAMSVDFHGQKRSKVDVEAERLTAWYMAVLGLSPVRRDLNLFMMLSGMRRTATC
ncbi:MAG TPA: integrase, partial [Xylella sp.]